MKRRLLAILMALLVLAVPLTTAFAVEDIPAEELEMLQDQTVEAAPAEQAEQAEDMEEEEFVVQAQEAEHAPAEVGDLEWLLSRSWIQITEFKMGADYHFSWSGSTYGLRAEDPNILSVKNNWALGEYLIWGVNVGQTTLHIYDTAANKNVHSYTVTVYDDSSTVGAFVDRLYQKVLGRAADAAGRQDWIDKLSSGQITGVDAAYGFFFSDEVLSRGLSNDSYVELLYLTLLGRSSDPAGKTDWVAQLSSGQNREQIFAGFANSAEFGAMCAAAGITQGSFEANLDAKDKYQVQAFVKRLYTFCLGRDADGGGLNGWTDQLMSGANTGTQAAHGFFFSAEMEGKNLSPGDYVEVLYKVMLNRNADGGGKAAWVRLLEQGQTREEIFYGFANSPEFDSICKSYGIKR